MKDRTGRTRTTGAAPQSPMMRARKRPRLRQEGGRDHLASPSHHQHRRTRPPAPRALLTVPRGSGPVAMAAVASEGRGEHGCAGSAGNEALAAAGGVFPQEQVIPEGWAVHPGAGLGPPVPLPAPSFPGCEMAVVPAQSGGRYCPSPCCQRV